MAKQIKNGATREDIYSYAAEKHGTTPEYLWLRFPLCSILRRPDNRKWYAIIMDIQKSKLGLKGEGVVDILCIKCDPFTKEILSCEKGFLPAYHLNRKNWIIILLDGSVDKEMIFNLLDESYDIAKGKQKKNIRYETTSWLIPANPKYYDIEKAFEENDVILWKQSNSVIVGDIVYLYIGAPYSCVLYRCEVTEIDIPYEYTDENLSMKKVMKLKRLYTYDKASFGLDRLKSHGIISVRGPRGIPYSLLCKLESENKN